MLTPTTPIEDRIRKVETTARIQRLVLMIMLGGVGFLVLTGQTSADQTSQPVVISDAAGMVRAYLGMDGDHVKFQLGDANGQRRMEFGVSPHGIPTCDLYDLKGNIRVRLACENDHSIIQLADGAGHVGVAITTSSDGNAICNFSDGNGQPRVSLGFAANVGAVSIMDAKGVSRIVHSVAADGASFCDFNDGDGQSRIRLSADDTKNAVMILASLGSPHLFLTSSLEHGAAMSMSGRAGMTPLQMGVDANGAPILNMRNLQDNRQILLGSEAGRSGLVLKTGEVARAVFATMESGEPVIKTFDARENATFRAP